MGISFAWLFSHPKVSWKIRADRELESQSGASVLRIGHLSAYPFWLKKAVRGFIEQFYLYAEVERRKDRCQCLLPENRIALTRCSFHDSGRLILTFHFHRWERYFGWTKYNQPNFDRAAFENQSVQFTRRECYFAYDEGGL